MTEDTDTATPSDPLQSDINIWEMCPDYGQPESPGTRKLQHLATTQPGDDGAEICARFVERPLSSGSVDLWNCAYGPAPNRAIQIPRKSVTAIYGAPKKDMCPKSDNNQSKGESSARKTLDHERLAREASDVNDGLPHHPVNSTSHTRAKSTASHADHHGELAIDKIRSATCRSNSDDGRALRRDSSPKTSKQAISTDAVSPVSSTGQEESAFIIVPPSRARSTKNHGHQCQPLQWSSTRKNQPSGPQAVVTDSRAPDIELENHLGETVHQAADPAPSRSYAAQGSIIHGTAIEENSSSTLGPLVEIGRSPIRVHEQQELPATDLHLPTNRAPYSPRASSNGKVVKRRPVSHKLQHRSLQASGSSVATAPSEEDLYFLLLHRLRQREQTEKQLTARLCHLESENGRLLDVSKNRVHQIEDLNAAGTSQAAEIRKQKAAIDDMKNRYPKIKEFVKQLDEDREILKSKFDTMEESRKELQDERKSLRQSIEEAQRAAKSSNDVVARVNGRLGGIQDETTSLESALHNARFQLHNEQQLLAQERRKISRLEAHVTDITRNQHRFSFTVQKEQQHLTGILNTINDKLCSFQENNLTVTSSANLLPFDQCLRMLRVLTQSENATSADVHDLSRVVAWLSQSVIALEKQSKDHCHQMKTATAEAGSVLLTQLTAKLTPTLVEDHKDRDALAKLREARNTLEERLDGSQNMLLEVEKGKIAAELREAGLRDANEKLLGELAALRQTAMAPRKGSVPMTELQNLLIKWTNANSLLAESLQRIETKDQQIQIQENRIQQLSAEARQAQEEKESLNQDNRILTERLAIGRDSMNTATVQILAEEKYSIDQLRKDLEVTTSREETQARELGDLKSAHDRLSKQANQVESKLNHAEQTCACRDATIQMMEKEVRQVDHLRKEVAHLSDICEGSELKDKQIGVLTQDLAALRAIEGQLECCQADSDGKTRALAELNEQFQNAQKALDESSALQTELDATKDENSRLRHFGAMNTSLQEELKQKEQQVQEIKGQGVQLEETLAELKRLRTQLGCWKNDYNAAREELEDDKVATTRIHSLEQDLAEQNWQVSKLGKKLAEAEVISKSVPEMEEKMHTFSASFKILQNELEIARQAADELQSTRTAKSILEEQVQKLQGRLSAEEGIGTCVQTLKGDLHEDNAEDGSLHDSLTRPHFESEETQMAVNSSFDRVFDELPRSENGHSVENDPSRNHPVSGDDLRSESADSLVQGRASRPERKRAVRNTDTVAANSTAISHPILHGKTGEIRNACLSEAKPNQSNEGHQLRDQDVDDTSIVPESQPCATPQLKRSSNGEVDVPRTGYCMSSSPLSDIGDLFDSPEKHQPSSAKKPNNIGPSNDREVDKRYTGDRTPSFPFDFQREASQDRDFVQSQLHQRQRPPSSSYGESLLLDDLERAGPLQGASLLDLPSVKSSLPSSHARKFVRVVSGALTHGANHQQGKKGAISSCGRPGSKSYVTDQIRHPGSLCDSKTITHSTTGLPSSTPVDEADDMARDETPTAQVKERHQPNSAIKRKSGSVATTEDIQSTGKKRTKRNLSNVEVVNPPAARSQSIQSSCAERAGPSFSRLRQSSNSSSSNRMTIVGKSAPASGTGKQGPKKVKGRSRSQRYNQRFGGQL